MLMLPVAVTRFSSWRCLLAVSFSKTVTVSTAGTPVQCNTSPVPMRKLYIQADPDNTVSEVIYVGGSDVLSEPGYELAPGEKVAIDFTQESLPKNSDLPLWWLNASANGLKANIFAVRA